MIVIAQSQPVRATVGESLDIRLKAVPTSGYTWELDPGGLPGIVEFVGAETIAAPGIVAGGQATQVFRFLAIEAGAARIKFRYRRRWEPEPIEVAEVGVVIMAAPASAGPA